MNSKDRIILVVSILIILMIVSTTVLLNSPLKVDSKNYDSVIELQEDIVNYKKSKKLDEKETYIIDKLYTKCEDIKTRLKNVEGRTVLQEIKNPTEIDDKKILDLKDEFLQIKYKS
ncbi:hypothetical protein EXN65_06005 [Clostridium botulinum]|uniref:Uncharacterized protein n=1 Tax=Clostridium botulinum TaxID=1491 RepID=A0A846I739_CLOBO|nr:hypothetical protein [Clostridium botulinum]AJE13325.1 hypothetical protein T259_4107 [Clostridium botulinum CDC_1436]EDT84509.1 hypothetical protein CBB_0895 [Clostridium botulinum Bf]MBO0524937.1 hypothetical protein [Clostridium botulinum]MBO0528112.1 hypothetical protein [Clostridium botulinum]MBO0532604.1 hypothetical protein [Clostridium botulinum]